MNCRPCTRKTRPRESNPIYDQGDDPLNLYINYNACP